MQPKRRTRLRTVTEMYDMPHMSRMFPDIPQHRLVDVAVLRGNPRGAKTGPGVPKVGPLSA